MAIISANLLRDTRIYASILDSDGDETIEAIYPRSTYDLRDQPTTLYARVTYARELLDGRPDLYEKVRQRMVSPRYKPSELKVTRILKTAESKDKEVPFYPLQKMLALIIEICLADASK